MPAPKDISELASRFDLPATRLNEADVKGSFIEPLFGLLGWDLHDHEQVQREKKTKAGRPDYVFKTGNQLQFLVEAKKPSENLDRNPSHALQLRRYAWNTDAPLSILTNFREFAVYDCRARPRYQDAPSVARFLYAPTPDHLTKQWKTIEAYFSQPAVKEGHSLDKFRLLRRGTERVDVSLLGDVERWRRDLAHDLARWNRLSSEGLNVAVQNTIDRILFLRICEDRKIEPTGQLENLAKGRGIYRSLCYLFEQSDQKYNSGLFHFQSERGQHSEPDLTSLGLRIDDDVLRDILLDLYLPKTAYDFEVLPVEVLGKVYERFIGREIRLTPSGEARLYEKPRVRQAGGVYYTPSWVVNYIVHETLDRVLDGKSLSDISSLKILDPACGSGSFLIGAYQRLLDWYLEFYASHDPLTARKGGLIYKDPQGDWKLSVPERKRILTCHIFGVDIDYQAVEVSKLSLLLKVLEGEADPQRRLFEERAMPDLSDNIKCGNSLVDLDFYEQRRLDGQDPELNAFSYRDEFPEVFRAEPSGFDLVLGNPPYKGTAGRPGHSERIEDVNKEYFAAKYQSATSSQYDLYFLFLERAIGLSRGFVGFIVPDAILVRDLAESIRRVILQGAPPVVLADAGKAFDEAETSNVVLILGRGTPGMGRTESIDETGTRESHPIDTRYFQEVPEARFAISVRPEDIPVIRKFRDGSIELRSLYSVSRGEEIGKRSLSGHGTTRILAGEDVAEFSIHYDGKVIPRVGVEKSLEVYQSRKLLVRQTEHTLVAAYDEEGFVTIKSLYNLVPREVNPERDWAVCAILNSKLARFVFAKTYGYKLVYPQLNQNWVESFPVKLPPPTPIARLAALATELSRISAMPDRRSNSQTERRLVALKRELDTLVYSIYHLEPAEVAIVERVAR